MEQASQLNAKHSNHHWSLRLARAVSEVFRPVYFPLVGVALLFQFTILSYFPLWIELMVLLLVAIGTLLLPRLTIRIWRNINGWDLHMLRHRRLRSIPYIVHVVFYAITLYYLQRMHLPSFVAGIIIVALLIQMVCTVVNMWWKISTHCAGAGGVIGVLVAYGFLFLFDPTWWLCVAILLAGVVGTSRMVLRQHTLAQTIVGTLVGFVCGIIGIFIA